MKKKTEPTYNMHCEFREGKRTHRDTYSGVTLEELREALAEYLDVCYKDGEAVKPKLSVYRKDLSPYCDEANVKAEFDRATEAYKTFKKVEKFASSGKKPVGEFRYRDEKVVVVNLGFMGYGKVGSETPSN